MCTHNNCTLFLLCAFHRYLLEKLLLQKARTLKSLINLCCQCSVSAVLFTLNIYLKNCCAFHWYLHKKTTAKSKTLQQKFGGWLSADVQDAFAVYAEECYKAFGDRVKQWLTLNEPWSFVRTGYSVGVFPPGRCRYTYSIYKWVYIVYTYTYSSMKSYVLNSSY